MNALRTDRDDDDDDGGDVISARSADSSAHQIPRDPARVMSPSIE